MICPSCGYNMSDDDKFCGICGTPATSTQQATNQQSPFDAPSTTQSQTPKFDVRSAVASTPAPVPQHAPATTTHDAVSPTTNNRLLLITLIIAAIALVLAIVSFIVPGFNSENYHVANAGTAQITIKAGESYGTQTILPANSNMAVVATSQGGDEAYSDVMFNNSTGELVLFSKNKQTSDVQREVYWMACDK